MTLAECPVHCEEEARPDGFNIPCTWDKTSETTQGSYIHITRALDFLLQKVKKIQEKVLSGTSKNGDDEWFKRDDTVFFLNANHNAYDSLDMSEVSKFMDTDVTAYDWR